LNVNFSCTLDIDFPGINLTVLMFKRVNEMLVGQKWVASGNGCYLLMGVDIRS